MRMLEDGQGQVVDEHHVRLQGLHREVPKKYVTRQEMERILMKSSMVVEKFVVNIVMDLVVEEMMHMATWTS